MFNITTNYSNTSGSDVVVGLVATDFIPYVPVVVAIRLVIIPISLVTCSVNLISLAALWKQAERHANLRLLLASNSVAAVLSALNGLLKSILFLANNHSMSSRTCTLMDMGTIIARKTSMFFVAAVALERFVAMRFHSRYESQSCFLGFLLVSLNWLQACCLYLISVYNSRTEQLVPFCGATAAGYTKEYVATLILEYTGIGLLSLLMYVYLLKRSKWLLSQFWKRKSHLTLSSRMQLRHTVDITTSLMPVVLMHAIWWLAVQAYNLLIVFGLPQLTFIQKTLALFPTEAFTILYFLNFALMLFCFNGSLRSIAVSLLLKACGCSGKLQRWRQNATEANLRKMVAQRNDDDYMAELREAWSQPGPQSRDIEQNNVANGAPTSGRRRICFGAKNE